MIGADQQQFCVQCGVTNDLHDGPDSCARAESKAQMIEMFGLVTR